MASEIFKKSLKKSLGMFNESEIKSNVTSSFDFSQQMKEVDSVINETTQLLESKKSNILSKTTTTLFEINGINIDTISNLDQLNETQKTIQKISNDYDTISNDITEVESIYKNSELKIDEINTDMEQKIFIFL